MYSEFIKEHTDFGRVSNHDPWPQRRGRSLYATDALQHKYVHLYVTLCIYTDIAEYSVLILNVLLRSEGR